MQTIQDVDDFVMNSSLGEEDLMAELEKIFPKELIDQWQTEMLSVLAPKESKDR